MLIFTSRGPARTAGAPSARVAAAPRPACSRDRRDGAIRLNVSSVITVSWISKLCPDGVPELLWKARSCEDPRRIPSRFY
ncbi:hypothetical protein GCM10007890_42580 [Methylobacterium tardum]|uniref:Uncharacterized protein n=1 Tax=Methylobacterium tardum TaxID=374432 RepID=A0AA37TF44_9HYPH|nr:hypothetical protein GCM10007890_42580 [Methylobacterium tardum]